MRFGCSLHQPGAVLNPLNRRDGPPGRSSDRHHPLTVTEAKSFRPTEPACSFFAANCAPFTEERNFSAATALAKRGHPVAHSTHTWVVVVRGASTEGPRDESRAVSVDVRHS
jgi:hypothetical protein